MKKTIIQAVETTKDEKDKEKLIRIVKLTLMKQINKDELEEIIKSKKGEVEVMEEVIERLKRDAIKEGLKEGLKQGLKEGVSSIIKNMLQKGIEVNEIKELTGVSKKEIEQIKQLME